MISSPAFARRLPPARTHFRVSGIATAVALFAAAAAAPQFARAAAECGADAAGDSVITCNGASYPGGISYATGDGLTLTLDNPAMVLGAGLAVTTPPSLVPTNLIVNATRFGSITGAAGAPAISLQHRRNVGLVALTMDTGLVSSDVASTGTIYVQGLAATDAQLTLNGGRVVNTGSGASVLAQTGGTTGTGSSSITINGGEFEAAGTSVRAFTSGSGTASIRMNGGTVLSTGGTAAAGNGLWAQQQIGNGTAEVRMTGGTVSAQGAHGDGIFASARNGSASFLVEMSGGQVSGGSGFGAAIHTAAPGGGSVTIGAGAVIDGSASGVALRDGDADKNGIDEVNGNVTITTAGTLRGAVLLGGGSDTLNITGGSIDGHITGDGADALNLDLGANRFVHGAAYAISGMDSIAMHSGTAQLDSSIAGHTLTVHGGSLTLTNANSYTGGTFLRGGVLSVASDANLGAAAGGLNFDGGTLRSSADFASARAVALGAGGGTFQTDGNLALSGLVSGAGALVKTGAATLTLTAANGYTGSTTISAGTLALAGAGSIAESSRVVADGMFDIAAVDGSGTRIRSLAGSGGVSLGERTLTLSAAADSFGGAITGRGGLVVAAGTQVLDGSNSYAGGTRIDAGATLRIGSGGVRGSIVGDVANEGTLVLDRAGTLALDGAISGGGAIRQAGPGLTRLGGRSAAFGGRTTVEAGTLAVDGVLGGSLAVRAGARLQGNGTVGPVTVAGTVAPGNSIGTLTVNGNFVQSAGAVYQAELDPASNAGDLIRASGSASIAGGARLEVVRAGSAAYTIGARYTVLAADGGVLGTYTLAGDTQSAFARLVDSYDANHVYLTAEKVRDFTGAAGTPNQSAVAGALDSLPAGHGLANAVAWLPHDAAARDAFNQLSMDIHASDKTAALQDSRFVREAAIDRLRAASCAPGSAPGSAVTQPAAAPSAQPQPRCTADEAQQRTSWGHVFGSWGHIDGNGNAARLERDIRGFVVGADSGLGAGGWRVGALAGYSRASTDTSARNSRSRTDSYHLGLYGGTQWGATALRLGASHSWNKADTRRSVGFAGFADSVSAEHDSSTTQFFGEAGWRIDAGGIALEPFAGLAHVRVRSDAFLERGGLAAVYAYGDSSDATFSTLGLRADAKLGDNTRLRGMLGWRHAFGGGAPTSTHAFGGSAAFTIEGVPLARNVAVIEAGVEMRLRPNLRLGASYAGQFGNGLKDHGLKFDLNWVF